MHDADVRRAVRRRLDESHAGDTNTRIVEELGIWSNSVRVDLAVINGEFHGIELKSARDTLDRLPKQAALYNEVFDRVTLVVAYKHLAKASEIVPFWWGLVAAFDCKDCEVRLETTRADQLNPQVSPLQVARLFWKSEALEVLEKFGIARGYRSKQSEEISQRLAGCLPLDTLRDEARLALKARERLGQSVAHMRDVAV